MKFHTGNFTRPVAGGKAIGEERGAAGRWLARVLPGRLQPAPGPGCVQGKEAASAE